jgi:hypothetical protein
LEIIEPHLNEIGQNIVTFLTLNPNITAAELQVSLVGSSARNVIKTTIRRRLLELYDLGIVNDGEKRECSVTHHNQVTWSVAARPWRPRPIKVCGHCGQKISRNRTDGQSGMTLKRRRGVLVETV